MRRSLLPAVQDQSIPPVLRIEVVIDSYFVERTGYDSNSMDICGCWLFLGGCSSIERPHLVYGK